MNKKQDIEKFIKQLYIVVDKLEQRIALLERLVPYWHKDSIEEIREEKNE
jgi:hypothetical protein